MTKVFLIGSIIILFFWLLVNFTSSPVPKPSASPIILPSTLIPEPSPFIVAKGESMYALYLQKIIIPNQLTLIPNFTEKLSSQTILETNKCTYGSNAGFYTKENTPLGLFITNNIRLVSSIHSNIFFNGFFYKTHGNNLGLSDQAPPLGTVTFVFQSGPLFTPQTQLLIKDDKPARRILISETEANEFYLLAVTNKDNNHSGPLLSDLPEIISRFNSSKHTAVSSKLLLVLNLDGGSASAFYSTQGKVLSEFTPIGSFLCGK